MNDTLWKLDLEEGDDASKVQKHVTVVQAAGHFNYAIVMDKQEIYSWGMGENYVLGNRDDCNEYFPYKLDPRMFENNKVVQIACGSNHIVVLALEEG